MHLYHIPNWENHYTCSQAKRIRRTPSWFPCPNRLDDPAIVLTRGHPRSGDLIAAWHIFLRIASQTGGTLSQPNGTPHDAASLHAYAILPVEAFSLALAYYSKPDINLIRIAQHDQTHLPIGLDTVPLDPISNPFLLPSEHAPSAARPRSDIQTEKQTDRATTKTIPPHARDLIERFKANHRNTGTGK